MYTLETLKEANPSKASEIRDRDVDKVNALLRIFKKNLTIPTPTPGDIIICHGYNLYHGKEVVYNRGLINEVSEDDKLRICIKPQAPFVCNSGALSTSGGYWFACASSEVIRASCVGERTFWCWDSWGARANGSVYFQAKVKVWEVTSDEVY